MLLLVGSGDNGGDALYAGALLARRGALGRRTAAQPVEDPCRRADRPAAAGGRVVDSAQAVRRPDVVVDGIVGIGGRGGLRPDAAAAVEALAGVPVVAVDTPSGVDVDTGVVDGAHVSATVTVTFGTHKVAHLVDPAALACGVVHLVDIGLDLPAAALTALQADDVARLLPRPTATAHKYTRGVVGVRAGSAQYPGAGVLCVAGAGSGLAGMVRYRAVPPTWCVPRTPRSSSVRDACRPGWSGPVEAPAPSRPSPTPWPTGCRSWSTRTGCAHVAGPVDVPALLTPHAGELARMLGVERERGRGGAAAPTPAPRPSGSAAWCCSRAATRWSPSRTDGCGSTTVGPPWLATAGAGDVLAGLCGALLAAGLRPVRRRRRRVVGARSRRRAGERRRPITAPRVAEAIPAVVRASSLTPERRPVPHGKIQPTVTTSRPASAPLRTRWAVSCDGSARMRREFVTVGGVGRNATIVG